MPVRRDIAKAALADAMSWQDSIMSHIPGMSSPEYIRAAQQYVAYKTELERIERGSATCPVCHREYATRKDSTLYLHNAVDEFGDSWGRCPGSGKQPRKDAL